MEDTMHFSNADLELDALFAGIDDLEFAELKEVTALPETAASSGSIIGTGCSTCGSSSSSCCST